MEVVLTLEHEHLHKGLFRWGLGWLRTLNAVRARVGVAANASIAPPSSAGSRSKQLEGRLSTFLASNMLDFKLYNFAHVVELLDYISYSLVEFGAQQGYFPPGDAGSSGSSSSSNGGAQACGYLGPAAKPISGADKLWTQVRPPRIVRSRPAADGS